MDFGHLGYGVLCCGGLLDGFNNCTIIIHNLSYDFVKNIINENRNGSDKGRQRQSQKIATLCQSLGESPEFEVGAPNSCAFNWLSKEKALKDEDSFSFFAKASRTRGTMVQFDEFCSKTQTLRIYMHRA